MTFRSMKIATAMLLATTTLPACAQETAPAAKTPAPAPTSAATPVADADPALWVVRDADTTVYLFGTIHMLKPGLTWFDEAVKTAFDKSDSVVFEIVTPEAAAMQQLMMTRGMNPTGPTLTEQLPADKRAGIVKAFADSGLPAQAYDRMDPWLAGLITSLGPITKLGYLPENGPETVLAAAAKSAGKPVTALETAEEQVGYFDGLSKPAQLQWLVSTVDELPKAGESMAKMVDTWVKGDPDALAVEMNDALKDSPEVAKALLTDRNARWATWIKNRMAQPGTVFVAVGAGHLAGGDSVQAKLAGLNVKSERVKY